MRSPEIQNTRVSSRRSSARRRPYDIERSVSLAETLDRVLNKGVVIAGDIIISVAGIDLLYLGVNLTLASVETMRTCNADKPNVAVQTTGGDIAAAMPWPGNGDGPAPGSDPIRVPAGAARGEV